MIDIDKVKELVCIGCPYDPEEISLDSELVGDLEMDSFSMLDIVMAFEKEYNISIPDRDLTGFVTVSDIVTYLEQKTQ